MAEYISKQDVIDYLNGYLHSIGECGADSLLFDRGQRRALINSIQDILAVKAADVQAIRHGRWIDCTFYDPYERSYEQNFKYKCSCCGHMIYNKPNDDDNLFCGHCSARMIKDGEQND